MSLNYKLSIELYAIREKNSSFPYADALGKALRLFNRRLAFVATFVSYSQFLATVCAASCQYAATICSCHTSAESVFVATTALARLECTFHCFM